MCTGWSKHIHTNTNTLKQLNIYHPALYPNLGNIQVCVVNKIHPICCWPLLTSWSFHPVPLRQRLPDLFHPPSKSSAPIPETMMVPWILACFRMLWMMAVCSAVSVFIYLMIARLIYYYRYPMAVSLDVNYEESLPFPVVTICNQNMFKYVCF